VLRLIVLAVVFALGLAVVVLAATGAFSGRRPDRGERAEARRLERGERAEARRSADRRRLSPVAVGQIVGGVGGMALAFWATELLGMAVLLGGLGVLLPPFMAAPRRRRQRSKEALAWQTWTRQLAELARAGAGLQQALTGSVAHAPEEVVDTVAAVAATAELRGIDVALDELASAGRVWEPEVAAGLRMAASAGGSVAGPLLDLGERIGDVVSLHRARTEAVVQLWTQTIALLSLAAGVVLLMYRNNPQYFEPYRAGAGQLVLVGIAGVLLLSLGFLVFHSVVRDQYSVLVPARRRSRARPPL
jgi:Flp pilus assembly protein TadB